MADYTVAIYFAEHEAGFLTGVAYANATLGTDVEEADYLYNGTFTDVSGGQMNV